MIPAKPPRPVINLDRFLADAVIAALRAGRPGALAACDAIVAARSLSKDYSVTWDREVPQ